MRTAIPALCFVIALVCAASPSHAGQRAALPGDVQIQRPVRIAVVNTPDVLLESLIVTFERETGYRVVLQITEGVFDLARDGMADLVIAHYGHAGTEAFMSEGLGR